MKLIDWLHKNQAKTLSEKALNVLICFAGLLVWVAAIQVFYHFLWYGQQWYYPIPRNWDMFTKFILAPVWEELTFRVLPIALAAALGRNFLLPTILMSSIIFGLGHGGPANILVQGVIGFVAACLYIKNDYSYLSAVSLHSVWNIFVYFLWS